jgi:hypothetical protein
MIVRRLFAGRSSWAAAFERSETSPKVRKVVSYLRGLRAGSPALRPARTAGREPRTTTCADCGPGAPLYDLRGQRAGSPALRLGALYDWAHSTTAPT